MQSWIGEGLTLRRGETGRAFCVCMYVCESECECVCGLSQAVGRELLGASAFFTMLDLR